MRILTNENGAGSLKVWLWLITLFLTIHVGYKLIPMYMDYERMKDDMGLKASTAQVMKDEEIRGYLVRKAMELELPLKDESFVLKRDEDKHTMTISAEWDVEVHFLFDAYIRTFHFAPVAEEDYTKTRR